MGFHKLLTLKYKKFKYATKNLHAYKHVDFLLLLIFLTMIKFHTSFI